MLDFKELPKNGDAFELLIREILLIKGFHVRWSGKGPDGGRDLLCYEDRPSEFLADRKTWLIQCKHNAHGASSVGVGDLDDIITSCVQHGADAYLLACSTVPSAGVINRLEGIANNSAPKLSATYWDATLIEQKLSTPTLWRIAQLFFPVSSQNSPWQFYATEKPNYWIVNRRGYHFHLANRIGSLGEHHFPSIDARIDELQKLDDELPAGHFIRIRAVNYDDKHSAYTWFLDYLFPHDSQPVCSTLQVAELLGDGYALEDGQLYSFNVVSRPYAPHHEHYDKDHYDYYENNISHFQQGNHRPAARSAARGRFAVALSLEKATIEARESGYTRLLSALRKVPFLNVIRSVNSGVEYLDKFTKLRDWREIVGGSNEFFDLNHLFSAWFLLDVGEHEAQMLALLATFDIGIDKEFHFVRRYLFTPGEAGGAAYEESEKSLFELSLRVHPADVRTAAGTRKKLNELFESFAQAIEIYCAGSPATS